MTNISLKNTAYSALLFYSLASMPLATDTDEENGSFLLSR